MFPLDNFLDVVLAKRLAEAIGCLVVVNLWIVCVILYIVTWPPEQDVQ